MVLTQTLPAVGPERTVTKFLVILNIFRIGVYFYFTAILFYLL
jgi:hypothetical protein